MGNRATVSIGKSSSSPCVYVHWNGGRASIEGFLQACKAIAPSPHSARDSMALLHKVALDFFASPGHAPSAYLETFGTADRNNRDNGHYFINSRWEIIGREFAPDVEEIDADKAVAVKAEALAKYVR